MKCFAVLIACLIFVPAVTQAAEWEPQVSLDISLKSAYVFAGATFNDGPVLQPRLYIAGLPLEFELWANYDLSDYDGALDEYNFQEVDPIVWYPVPTKAFDLTVGLGYFIYPTSGYNNDTTILINFSKGELPVSFGLYGEYYLGGEITKTCYLEPFVSHTYKVNDDLCLTVRGVIGYFDYHKGEDGWSHWNASTDLTYKLFTLGVEYNDQIDDDVLVNGQFGYDVKWVFSAGVSYTF